MKKFIQTLMCVGLSLGYFSLTSLGHAQEIIRDQLINEYQDGERNLVDKIETLQEKFRNQLINEQQKGERELVGALQNDSSESEMLKKSRPPMQQSNLTVSVDCMAQYYKHMAECLESGKSDKVCYQICGDEFWECYGDHPEEGPAN